MQGQVLKYHILVLLMLLTVFSFSASAQVDWTKGTVRAKGMGLPSPDMPAVQAKLLAKRAAMSDAYRKLAEIVQGVQVTSETIVKNFVTESDEIHTKVEAFIKGALVVEERQDDDGSYEVTMEAPIYGVGSLSDSLLGEVAKKSDKYDYVAGDETGGEAYTGLLIDARGVDVKPSLAPSVFNTNAEIVYDASMLDASAYSQGVAAFVEGEEDLLNEGMLPSHPFLFAMNAFTRFDASWFYMPPMVIKKPGVKNKVGNKPLVIKAVDPKKAPANVINLAPYNVIVSPDDGKKIVAANNKNFILNYGNVAILTSMKLTAPFVIPAQEEGPPIIVFLPGIMGTRLEEPVGIELWVDLVRLVLTSPADINKLDTSKPLTVGEVIDKVSLNIEIQRVKELCETSIPNLCRPMMGLASFSCAEALKGLKICDQISKSLSEIQVDMTGGFQDAMKEKYGDHFFVFGYDWRLPPATGSSGGIKNVFQVATDQLDSL